MTKEEIIEQYANDDTMVMFADGFDEAILGFCESLELVVYSSTKALEIIKKQMMDVDETLCGVDAEEMAREHFSFNVEGSKGTGYPIWVEV